MRNKWYNDGGMVGSAGPASAASMILSIQRDPQRQGDSDKDMNAFDRELFKRGISHVESEDGIYMKPIGNQNSTARGLYMQKYSEIEDHPLLEGITIDEFMEDQDLQNRVMDLRIDEGLPNPEGGHRGLPVHAQELIEEYAPQIGNAFDYTPEEVAALVYFLGRQGTRNYFGYHLRDGQPLDQAMPKMYGTGAKAKNMLPTEYLEKFNEVMNQQRSSS